jgi:hypothetical protein
VLRLLVQPQEQFARLHAVSFLDKDFLDHRIPWVFHTKVVERVREAVIEAACAPACSAGIQ